MEPQDTSRKPSTRAKVATAFTNEMGRIPPQAIELEQVVLGAMMLERNAVNDTIDILNEQSFYDPKHQYIFKAIRDLFASTNPVLELEYPPVKIIAVALATGLAPETVTPWA